MTWLCLDCILSRGIKLKNKSHTPNTYQLHKCSYCESLYKRMSAPDIYFNLPKDLRLLHDGATDDPNNKDCSIERREAA